jgi:5'-nucleotidase
MRPATVFVDLDGVLADFDAAFPRVFNLNHRNIDDETMSRCINGHPSFFADLEPMPQALDFFKAIRCLKPIILTACPKGAYAAAALQKRQWVRQHLGDDVMVLPVMGGGFKPLFMQADGDILIDDYRRNIEQWNHSGGTGILHRNFQRTVEQLNAALL